MAIERLNPRQKRWIRWTLLGLISAAIHVFVVVPYGIARLLMPSEQVVEIAYLPEESDSAAPSGTAAADAPEPALQPPKPKELAKKEETPEDPAKREEKPKPKEEPKKPEMVVIPNAHLKMVDQDQYQEEKDNADAHYLAQKNHRAEQETRATETNLLRNQLGEQVQSENQNKQPDPGDKDHKIAELQDHPAPDKHLPVQSPSKERPGPLAMRDTTPVNKISPNDQLRDGVELQEPGVGPLPMARAGRDEEAGQSGSRQHLSLSYDDYDRIVGFDVAEKERRDALLQRSHTPGRWDKVQQKLAMMRSSLENFTPSVRPGNQTELGTRAHPFAAYIATMHRQIHKYWGFGFLSDIELRRDSAYSDRSLWSSIEITLNEDGTIDKLVISRPSGSAPYDTAALDAVMSAGPFPTPPDSIKSRDGHVYLDWRFHRDERQCATDFVEPHILTIPRKDGEKAVAQGAAPSRPAREPSLSPLEPLRQRQGRQGSSPALAGTGGGTSERSAERASERSSERASERSSERAVSPAGGASGQGVPDEARTVAQKWLAAFVKGDPKWLAGFSALPFSAGGQTVDDASELRAMYRQMLAEGDHPPGTMSFYTPSQIRKKLGKLPQGGDDDDMMFAMVKSGKLDLVLLLQAADKGWRVVGLNR